MPPMSRGGAYVFWLVLSFRLVNAQVLRTFFQPDEYYQALEPAWRLAFGEDAGAYITWEWKNQLRSSLHPLLFAAVYQLAHGISNLFSFSSKNHAHILLVFPKLAQAILAAISDICTWNLAHKLSAGNEHAAWTTLALSILSPWQFFVSVRTFSNSLETALTAAALTFWPWVWTQKSSSSDLRYSLFLAALAVILRPTNLLIWIPLGTFLVIRASIVARIRIVKEAVISGISVLILSAFTDRWFYGQWTVPALQFLHFNISQGLAVFYGRNRLEYYFTEGLGLLLTTALPFAIIGISREILKNTSKLSYAVRPEQIASCLLSWTIMFVMLILSVVSHKEVRFLYPLLPALHVIAGERISKFLRRAGGLSRIVVALFVFCNICIAYYVSQVHQKGVIDIVHYIREQHEIQSTTQTMNTTTVGIFMPCHSTPWRSHLIHKDIKAWALACEPPIGVPLEARETYMDEADQFYADPQAWVTQHMTSIEGLTGMGNRVWPQYLVFFEQLEADMKSIMHKTTYKECWRTFNSHWHDDWRRRGDVIVWCSPDVHSAIP